jgi:hypothetical protein
VVAHSFNPSTWEAEAGEFLSSRPAWSTEWVPGQPGLQRETLSWKTKKQKNCSGEISYDLNLNCEVSWEDQGCEHKEDTKLVWGGLHKLWTMSAHTLCSRASYTLFAEENGTKSADSCHTMPSSQQEAYHEMLHRWSTPGEESLFPGTDTYLPWDPGPHPSPSQVYP